MTPAGFFHTNAYPNQMYPVNSSTLSSMHENVIHSFLPPSLHPISDPLSLTPLNGSNWFSDPLSLTHLNGLKMQTAYPVPMTPPLWFFSYQPPTLTECIQSTPHTIPHTKMSFIPLSLHPTQSLTPLSLTPLNGSNSSKNAYF